MFVNNQEDVILQIQNHAERSFPNECCGVVLKGRGGFEYIELENKSESPQTSFAVDSVFIATRYEEIEYIVHSHVNGSPEPSRADIAMSNRIKKPLIIVSIPTMTFAGYRPSCVIDDDIVGREFFYAVNDCMTIVEDYYRSEFGVVTDVCPVRLKYNWWKDVSDASNGYIINEFKQRGFYEVSTPENGDVILIRFPNSAPAHLGIYMNDGSILHSAVNLSSKKETYGAFLRKYTLCYLRTDERN